MDLPLINDSATTLPPSPPRYRIEALGGRGAAGSVFRAFDLELGRLVALKFLRDDRPEHRARMLREARAQARVDHPNVCRIFDVAEDVDRLYIAMQWIDGVRLDAIAPRLSLEEKVGVLRDVAGGVHAAHAEGVIHRDLKPANILVERGDDGVLHPYVVDFGLARANDDAAVTATGEVVGTPHYLSPEQAWGLPVDRRSDVYSLGATFYELLSGAPPFRGETPTDVMMQVISRPVTPLWRVVRSVPRDLAVICGMCLEKEPERRYDSARALRDDLERWLTGEPIHARAPGLFYRAQSLWRRHRAVAASIVLATIVTGTVAGSWIQRLQRDSDQRDVAAKLEDRVAYIERFLAHDRALPLHDTRPALGAVAGEIRRLSTDVPDAPLRFPAPLSYAEGRARLATGDTRAARASLARAWKEGFQTPAVAYHFAVALTAEHVRQLREAERISDEGARRARIAALESAHRREVAPLLQTARHSVEQPAAMVGARIAFAGGDDAQTIALTRTVIARFPWNIEARLLQADAYVRDARARRLRGDVKNAEEAFARARQVYERALVTSPSDPRVHDGLCGIAADLMQIGGPFSTQLATDGEKRFDEARAACERALVADPDRVSAWVALSTAWSLEAFRRQHDGEADAEQIAKSIEAVEQALRLAPDDPHVLVQGGLTYWRTRRPSRIAIEMLRRAVALDPSSPEARHSLGRAYLSQHDELSLAGQDPRAALDAAAHENREAIRLAPAYTAAYSNLGIALNHYGNYMLRVSDNPEPYFREAATVLDGAIARSPELAEPRSICAHAWIGIAAWRAERREDPWPEAQRGIKRLSEAIALNPDYLGDYYTRAGAWLLVARATSDAVRRRVALREADVDLRHIEAKSVAAGAGNRAEWWILAMKDERDRKTALAAYDRADAAVAQLIAKVTYTSGDHWLARARLQHHRCKWTGDCRLAEEYFAKALEITPDLKVQVERARAE